MTLTRYSLQISYLSYEVAEEKRLDVSIAEHLLDILGPEEMMMEDVLPPLSTNQALTSEATTTDQEATTGDIGGTLPAICLNEDLDGHQCRCEICEPASEGHLLEEAENALTSAHRIGFEIITSTQATNQKPTSMQEFLHFRLCWIAQERLRPLEYNQDID